MTSRRRLITAAMSLAATAIAPARRSLAQAPTQTIRVMGWWGTFEHFRPGWELVVREFERQNPGVHIEYTATAFDQTLNQITTAVLGNNAPDMVSISPVWMEQLNAIGALEALEPYVPAEELRQIPPRLLEDMTVGGAVRALPQHAGPIMMVYNRDLLREAGLNPTQPPRTWPEFVEAVRRVCALPARANGKVYGVAGRTERNPLSAMWTIPLVWANGGEIVDASGNLTVTTAPAVAAFTWYRDTIRSGCSPDGATVADTRNLFGQGRAGFIFEGPWSRGIFNNISGGRLRMEPDGNVWVARMPAGPDGRVRQIANHGAIAMMRQARNKELTARFMRFVIGDPQTVDEAFATSNVITTGRMDLLHQGRQGANPYAQVFVESLNDSIAVPIRNARWAAGMDAVSAALQRIVQGADPATELAQAQREGRRLMTVR
jgi:ABC-type glycerol-3-phosphate transport system substrate-binding protein